MQHLSLYFALFLTLGHLIVVGQIMLGNRTLKRLSQIPTPPNRTSLPTLSLIIPARNEADTLEAALHSVLAQTDYPGLEILVINDRSTDHTGEVLARIQATQPSLNVIPVESLPPGWLGKNHALQVGADLATGELLLFTDADIVFAPGTLRRAVSDLQNRQLDHLALLPNLTVQGGLLGLFMAAFPIFFCLYAKPWNASNPKSKDFIGVGAFNLIRKSVYQAIGGHAQIRMRPDDDVKLGKVIKHQGYRQDVLLGSPLVSVEWYPSLKHLAVGLEKNTFAGLDYNWATSLIGPAWIFMMFVWGSLGVFFTTGEAQLLYGFNWLLVIIMCWDNTKFIGNKPWAGLGFPLACAIFVYVLYRALWITWRNNGIHWRDTFYSLDELKANKV